MCSETLKVRKMAAEKHSLSHQQAEMLEVECPIGKKKAAKILGISTDTLDQWTTKYGIPHYKYAMEGNSGNRGKVVYLASDLVEFREKFRVERRDIDRDPDRLEERDIGAEVDRMIRDA
jgi:hypothetical protein